MARWGESSLDTFSPWFFSDNDVGDRYSISTIALPHIIPLSKDGDNRCRVIMQVSPDTFNNMSYEKIIFAYEKKDELEQVYNELKQGGMEIVTFSDDDILGTVNVTDNKNLLFTSIPFNKEWKVYVDGKEERIVPLLKDAFCGVKLEKGEHEIRFVYKSRWNLWGRMMGMAGMLIWGLVLYTEKMRKR